MSKPLLKTTCISDWPCYSKGYQLLSAIGKGHSGSGIVWKAQVTEGVHKGKHIAIKKLYLEKCDSTKIQEIRKNIFLLNLLNHSNILSYKVCFVHKKDLWIVSDLMDAGSLDKLIQYNYPDGLKDQALIATIIKEILEGLKYLHQNNQVHRNVKAANILVSSDGSVKLSDFGVAAKLKDGKKRSTLIGSPCWMAPEVLNQDTEEGYDYKVDLWSLGITALELAQGNPPGHDLNTMQLILRTLNDEPPRLGDEGCWDESFREFLSFCLVKEPNQRKSAIELLRCCKSFFNKAKGKHYIVEKLLKGTGPLESRIDQETIDAAQAELKEDEDSQRPILKFNFKLPEQQDHKEMCRLVDQFKIQLTRSHLPKVETEFILRRTLTVGTPSLADVDFCESMNDLEPRSADFANKFVSRQKLQRAIYRCNTVKLDSCTGDKLDTLGEEEI